MIHKESKRKRPPTLACGKRRKSNKRYTVITSVKSPDIRMFVGLCCQFELSNNNAFIFVVACSAEGVGCPFSCTNLCFSTEWTLI